MHGGTTLLLELVRTQFRRHRSHSRHQAPRRIQPTTIEAICVNLTPDNLARINQSRESGSRGVRAAGERYNTSRLMSRLNH